MDTHDGQSGKEQSEGDSIRGDLSSPDPNCDLQAFELFEKMRNSEGEKIYWRMEGLRAIYYVFSQNYAELSSAIAHFEADESFPRYWHVQQRHNMRAFQQENMRLLHNVVAAAFSLVDQTRILVREIYGEEPFQNEYQRKVDEVFSNSEIAGLVKGLRNWMLHRGLVPVDMQATLDATGKFAASIVLNINELRSWDRWDPRARHFLETAPDPLRLRDVVDGYYELVKQLYDWLASRMAQIHASAFDEWASWNREYRKLRPDE